jgi:hypothetical protein
MHGHILETVHSAKYLGITISSDLKWNKLIQQISSKANISLSFIQRDLKINSKTVKDQNLNIAAQHGILIHQKIYTA